MTPMETTATIAAVSTPPGEGAIALVRLSGPQAIAVADKIFRGKQKPSEATTHLQQFGEIIAGDRVLDQVMLAVHRAPASYTGEDVVEISCHGGVLVTARVWEACLHAGARAARPGEFTERAFLHGKMDLTQAEAVIDLIRAQTDLALRSAAEQLEGRLGERITRLREDLVSSSRISRPTSIFPMRISSRTSALIFWRGSTRSVSRANRRAPRDRGPGPHLSRGRARRDLRRDQCRQIKPP